MSWDFHLVVNGKVCKNVVRPGLMHGAKTRAVKKAQEKKLCGVKTFDGQNEE